MNSHCTCDHAFLLETLSHTDIHKASTACYSTNGILEHDAYTHMHLLQVRIDVYCVRLNAFKAHAHTIHVTSQSTQPQCCLSHSECLDAACCKYAFNSAGAHRCVLCAAQCLQGLRGGDDQAPQGDTCCQPEEAGKSCLSVLSMVLSILSSTRVQSVAPWPSVDGAAGCALRPAMPWVAQLP